MRVCVYGPPSPPQRCESCQRPGATVGCCLTSCSSSYHFMCARQKHCVFLEDKKVYCQRHRDLSKGEVRANLVCSPCLSRVHCSVWSLPLEGACSSCNPPLGGA